MVLRYWHELVDNGAKAVSIEQNILEGWCRERGDVVLIRYTNFLKAK